MGNEITPFEVIRRTNPEGNEFWSSRDFAKALGYADYRNFLSVIESARTACFKRCQRGTTISSGSTKWSRSAAARSAQYMR